MLYALIKRHCTFLMISRVTSWFETVRCLRLRIIIGYVRCLVLMPYKFGKFENLDTKLNSFRLACDGSHPSHASWELSGLHHVCRLRFPAFCRFCGIGSLPWSSFRAALDSPGSHSSLDEPGPEPSQKGSRLRIMLARPQVYRETNCCFCMRPPSQDPWYSLTVIQFWSFWLYCSLRTFAFWSAWI